MYGLSDEICAYADNEARYRRIIELVGKKELAKQILAKEISVKEGYELVHLIMGDEWKEGV